MNKLIKAVTPFIFFITMSGCAYLNSSEVVGDRAVQWDFDHHVQFIQTKLTNQHYLLEIIPNNKVPFERLTSFLIRKSYSLCGSYHYKLEMIKGIEGFNDQFVMKNYIFPSLTAKIEC